MQININIDAVVKYTNKLEKISRSALPIAVRSTLNDAVFDVKTKTMPGTAKSEFEERRKNFFTANSKFEAAKGFDIKSMSSKVGFYENKLSNQSTNYAVKDLEEQEQGGNIDSKSFIPMSTARVGKNGNVRPNARLKAIRAKGIVVARNMSAGKTKGEKFIQAVFKAGAGGFVLGSEVKGQNILWRVNSLSTNINTRKLDLTPLYDFSKGRSINVKATHFMKEASEMSAKKMDVFYLKNAQKQLKKYWDR